MTLRVADCRAVYDALRLTRPVIPSGNPAAGIRAADPAATSSSLAALRHLTQSRFEPAGQAAIVVRRLLDAKIARRALAESTERNATGNSAPPATRRSCRGENQR
jgi:hypothetical protein